MVLAIPWYCIAEQSARHSAPRESNPYFGGNRYVRPIDLSSRFWPNENEADRSKCEDSNPSLTSSVAGTAAGTAYGINGGQQFVAESPWKSMELLKNLDGDPADE
jgi:hypothetical protein